nr:MAG TPA: hypothetical protein [Caudoviricetes sp.]
MSSSFSSCYSSGFVIHTHSVSLRSFVTQDKHHKRMILSTAHKEAVESTLRDYSFSSA